MKKTLTLLILLSLATVAFAAGPTLTISPSALTMRERSTTVLKANFNDGSTIEACVWTVTGGNTIYGTGAEAFLATGQTPGPYTISAACANNNGITQYTTSALTVTAQ